MVTCFVCTAKLPPKNRSTKGNSPFDVTEEILAERQLILCKSPNARPLPSRTVMGQTRRTPGLINTDPFLNLRCDLALLVLQMFAMFVGRQPTLMQNLALGPHLRLNQPKASTAKIPRIQKTLVAEKVAAMHSDAMIVSLMSMIGGRHGSPQNAQMHLSDLLPHLGAEQRSLHEHNLQKEITLWSESAPPASPASMKAMATLSEVMLKLLNSALPWKVPESIKELNPRNEDCQPTWVRTRVGNRKLLNRLGVIPVRSTHFVWDALGGFIRTQFHLAIGTNSFTSMTAAGSLDKLNAAIEAAAPFTKHRIADLVVHRHLVRRTANSGAALCQSCLSPDVDVNREFPAEFVGGTPIELGVRPSEDVSEIDSEKWADDAFSFHSSKRFRTDSFDFGLGEDIADFALDNSVDLGLEPQI